MACQPKSSATFTNRKSRALSPTQSMWHGSCTAQDRKDLQPLIKTERFIGAASPSFQDIYTTRVIRRAHNIIKDSTHPQHSLFTSLPSGRRYRSVKSRTTRLINSFYPQAIRLLSNTFNTAPHSPSLPLTVTLSVV